MCHRQYQVLRQFTDVLLSRWLSEEGRRTGSWIPFGSGPRMCVGYVFALQEMKVSTSALRTFGFTLCSVQREAAPVRHILHLLSVLCTAALVRPTNTNTFHSQKTNSITIMRQNEYHHSMCSSH